MDPLMMITTALAAGAAAGVSGSASSAVQDAYAELKALVRKRLAGRPDVAAVLAGHEREPEAWRARLMAELEGSGAGDDTNLAAAAQVLLGLAAAPGTAGGGKYAVDARGAWGVQVGDRNRQDNVFGPPGGLREPDGEGSWRAGPGGRTGCGRRSWRADG